MVVVAFGLTTLFMPWQNGAVFGILAFTCAYISEAVVLGWHLFGKNAPPFPAASKPTKTD